MINNEELAKLERRAKGAMFLFKMFLFVAVLSGIMIAGMSWWVGSLDKELESANEEIERLTTTVSVEPEPAEETLEDSEVDSARAMFGPLVSPNGGWLLEVKHEDELIQDGDLHKNKTNRLVARSLTLLEDRVLFTEDQSGLANLLNQPVEGQPSLSIWQPAGWSADGAKAYYVAQFEWSGLGGLYPTFYNAGEMLFEVDVWSGERKLLFDLGKPLIINGIKDVYPAKDLIVYSRETDEGVRLYSSRLNGEEEKLLLDLEQKGASNAVLDMAGKRVAFVSHELIGDHRWGYTLVIIDLETGSMEEVDTDPDGWQLHGWKNSETLTVYRFLDMRGLSDLDIR
ncbi:MAG: hypothetical protein U9Q03_05670 [Patescibacteria group bacterium]|nr:hypothetical protein [Patescibacteria group bacterium]